MTLPHERSFAYRQACFWLLSGVALVLGLRTPGLTPAAAAGGIAIAAITTWIGFRYTRWLISIDKHFRDVHPFKIRVATLAAFYGSCIMAVAVLIVGARLPANPTRSALENASPLLLVPALLASAAGALRGGRDGGVID